MSRVLVVGLGPLPFENTKKNFGPGIRTWQFASGLSAKGHDVDLISIAIPGVYQEDDQVLAEETRDRVSIERWPEQRFGDHEGVQRRLNSKRYDAVVGATIYGSHLLAQCDPKVPFWADQFGHVMAEAQVKASVESANWPLAYFWKMVREIDVRADRISTVSRKQRLACMGELGATGRLNAENCGTELVEVIPCALMKERRTPKEVNVELKGHRLPEDAFMLLWSGSYNTWSDVETLYAGVSEAMRQNPNIWMCSTGGQLDGHDESTYPRFQQLVADGGFADRFLLEGWVDGDAVASYVEEADLGVLTEKSIYEGELGSKNRIAEWMAAGLPVAYNQVGDIGDDLARYRLGLTFPVGDSAGLAKHLVWGSENRDDLRSMAERAYSFADRHYSVEASIQPLAMWAQQPSFSPDHQVRVQLQSQFSPLVFESGAGRLAEAVEALPVPGSGKLRRGLGRVARGLGFTG